MSDDLFAEAKTGQAPGPLADRMRPRNLDEFVGQDHIVGPGRLLRRAIQRDRLSSIILSGPPGTGKTTLARVIANTTKSRFLSINAVLSGVQAIRDAVESAKRERQLYDRKTILFVDEVHRWNKAQQDALLPYVENGTIILIGATTENPFFEVNKALVSRSRVFQLHALGDDDLRAAALAALADRERGYGRWRVSFEEGALEHLVKVADGDARSLLNALELAVETSVEPWPPTDGAEVLVTMEAAEESIQRRAVLYDQDGDYHYDAASALIKSVRGSDPDAALYWMARMVYAGEDPRFIFRRLLISASEDIGLADPDAIGVVESCAAAYERIGLPEGQFHLAQAALYLATAPKSNSSLAYFDALAAVEAESASVPDHLKDASRDADGLGHGVGYLYPHAYRTHWTAQQYLPESLKGALFYQPGTQGYEARVRDDVLRRRDAQLAAWLSGDLDAKITAAGASAAAGAMGQNSWTDRAEAGAASGLSGLRDAVFKLAFPPRHANVLVLAADDGLLLREAVRLCPEGSACGLCRDQASIERLAYTFGDVEDIHKPSVGLMPADDSETLAEAAARIAGHANFDLIVAAGYLSGGGSCEALRACTTALALGRDHPVGVVVAERAPLAGILPGLAKPYLEEDLFEQFLAADAAFYASDKAPGLATTALRESLAAAGFSHQGEAEYRYQSKRSLGEREAAGWLSPESTYGGAIASALGEASLATLTDAIRKAFASGPVLWPAAWSILLLA